MKNKKTGKNRKPGNEENLENLENLETKNYNPPGKKLEFSRVGGRGAWLPLWLLKKKGVPVLKLLWQRSWRLLSPSLVSLRAVSSWVLHVLTFASRFFFGQPPRPYHSVLVFNTIFPHFATWRSEIGDRRPGQRFYSAGIGDRRSDQSLYRAGIGDQRSDARLRPLAGETSRSTHRVSDPVSDLRSPIRSG